LNGLCCPCWLIGIASVQPPRANAARARLVNPLWLWLLVRSSDVRARMQPPRPLARHRARRACVPSPAPRSRPHAPAAPVSACARAPPPRPLARRRPPSFVRPYTDAPAFRVSARRRSFVARRRSAGARSFVCGVGFEPEAAIKKAGAFARR